MCRCILRMIYMMMHARYDLYHITFNNHCALLIQDSRFKHRLFHKYTNNLYASADQMHMACGIHVVLNLSIQIGHLITFLKSYHPMPPDSYGHIRHLRSFIDSYDHISTVTIIPRGQLRSCRWCLVCKLRSYHESFTSPYFKNKSTD